MLTDKSKLVADKGIQGHFYTHYMQLFFLLM